MAKSASTTLGKLWVNALSGQTETSVVHLNFMQALGTYITSNVTFTVSFSGALISYPFTPISIVDSSVTLNGAPVMSYVSSFLIPAKDGNGMYTDGLTEWIKWMTNCVYAGIRQSLIVGPLTAPTGVIQAFMPMISPTFNRDDLKSVHENNWNDSQAPVLDKLATLIMSDMRQFFTPSYPAIYNGAYIGTATVTKCTTP